MKYLEKAIEHPWYSVGTVIALPIVLAVVGWLIPIGITWDDIFFRERSRLNLVPSTSSRDYITLLIENKGNRSGSIGRVTVQFIFHGDAGVTRSSDLRLDVVEHGEGAVVVEPKSTKKIRVFFSNKDRLATVKQYMTDAGRLKSAECTFGFDAVNHDGKESRHILKTDCAISASEFLGLNNRATIRF